MTRARIVRTKRRRAQRGFNLIEVMIALAVMLVAVVGAASLQTATTRSNMAARNRTVAMEFLQTWLERVKMDAMPWRFDATSPTLPSLFANNADGVWFTPTAAQLGTLGQVSGDFWGRDTTTTANIRYCVNLRGTVLSPARALRADVRVWWYREGGDSALTATTSVTLPDGGAVQVSGPIEARRNLVVGCGTAATAPVNDPRVYSITASTILTAVNP